MKKLNFNSLQSLQTPESWIDNALAIPEKESKKSAFIPLRPRIIAAAASIVLVTAVSVALFLTMGNKPPVEIRPSSDGNVQTPTSYAGDIFAAAASESAQPDTVPTSTTEEKAEQLRQAINNVIDTAAQTQSGTAANPTTPSGTQSAASEPSSQAPTTKPTQKATVKPTEKATQTATEITIITPTTKPTQAPTQKPTQKPEQNPTEATWDPPTETPWIPSTQPTINATEVATEPAQPTLSSVTISVTVYVRNTTAIYCKITDPDDGSVYGDPDLFSDEHLATVTGTSMNTVSCEYKPGDHGIMLIPGKNYYFTFYDSDGRMLSRGTFKNR